MIYHTQMHPVLGLGNPWIKEETNSIVLKRLKIYTPTQKQFSNQFEILDLINNGPKIITIYKTVYVVKEIAASI